MRSKNQIVVIGSSHHNTFSMVRSFGHAGFCVDVILFGCKQSYIEKSKYVSNMVYVDSPIEVVEYLRIKDYENKPVLISCADIVSQQLDEHYDEFAPKFHFFNCGEQGRLTQLLDKQIQTEMAGKAGLQVPVSMVYEKGMTFESYPCILKPLESIDGGKHIEICQNQQELDEKIQSFAGSKVLVQSFIERVSEIVVVGLSLKDDIIIPGYIYKIRENAGGTTYSKVYPIDRLYLKLVQKCKELVRSMDYIGLFGIEFVEDKEGNYYFIEINLRNDATTYSLTCAGVNLPAIYAEYCEGNCDFGIIKVNEIYSIVDFKDFVNAMHLHVPIKQWWHEYRAAECKYYKDKDDPRPYRVCLRSFFKSHILHKLKII